MIPLNQYTPDLPDFKNEGMTKTLNVFPVAKSYRPLKDLSPFSAALTETALGATPAKQTDGANSDFVGTASGLYKLQAGATWEDVSVGGGYTTTEFWRFTQWGNDVLATNFSDAIQTYTLGTSTDFAVLSAGAPKARYIASTDDFIIVGSTFDGVDGNQPTRVRWCAIGDPTDWTVSATTQADYQDLDASNGWIQGIVSGDDVYVFQEKAITRFRYVGSPTIFSRDVVEPERGCYIPNSIIPVGNLIFYIGEDGFYIFDGVLSTPIGEGRVDKTFFSDLSQTYKDRVSTTVDPINKLIIWAYPSNESTGNPDKLIIYNWVENKWSHAEVDLEILWRSTSLGYTLEGLDTVSTNIDTMTESFDSRLWMGGANSLTAFNTDHKMSYFTGDQLTGVLETGEDELAPGRRSFLKRIRPILDGTFTLQVGARNTQNDTTVWGSVVSPDSNGECPVSSNARFHRIRINTTTGLTHVQGLDVLESNPSSRY